MYTSQISNGDFLMAPKKDLPLVSIGLPVYNGEKLIRRAVDSILAQDYRNFELILSDDASNDNTPRICKEYADKDSRVVYYQSDCNRGSVWNHNRVFELARGKYFAWISQDDLRAPQFISKCVERLEANERAVLCHTYTAAFIGDPENLLAIITHDTMDGISSPVRRYITAMKSLPASAIEAVFRTDIIKARLYLFEDYISSDIVLTRELALYGEFLQVPEILSLRSARYVRPSPQEDYAVLTGGNKMSRFHLPALVLIHKHAQAIERSSLRPLLKCYLWGALLKNEVSILFAKVLFRSAWAMLNLKCPQWIFRYSIAAIQNPNIRPIKPVQELPPQLQPAWLLLNHRDIERAKRIQEKIIIKILNERMES
jgi:glycosyltransferase involved in cell wall biosynthesis